MAAHPLCNGCAPTVQSLHLDTISDDYGPAASCRRMDRRGPLDSHESAVGRLEQLADEGQSDSVLRD